MAVIINGWPPDSPLFQDREMIAGRLPIADDHHKVIIGEKLAATLEKGVGKTIKIYDTEVEIIGIFRHPSVFENGSIATLLSDMQEFMNRPHQVTGFIIRTDIPKDAPDRQEKIAAVGKQIECSTRASLRCRPASSLKAWI